LFVAIAVDKLPPVFLAMVRNEDEVFDVRGLGVVEYLFPKEEVAVFANVDDAVVEVGIGFAAAVLPLGVAEARGDVLLKSFFCRVVEPVSKLLLSV
jgi:hypothetical protein